LLKTIWNEPAGHARGHGSADGLGDAHGRILT